MSNNFSWQTDEEEGWSEPIASPQPVDTSRSWLKRRWWIILSLLLVAGLGAAVTYRQYQQRLTAVERDVTTDLMAGVETMQRAVSAQDVELFRLNLSGRDQRWTATQIALFEEQLLFDRSTFGLRWSGEITPPANERERVTLDPDLRGGQVPLKATYETAAPNGETRTITLEINQVYRQAADGRWLLAPPEDAYWGEWESVDFFPMHIYVSRRDADLARRMAADLERDLARFCTSIGGCQPFYLRMERDPASLVNLAGAPWIFEAGALRGVPTPTLVGRPVDEAGYQALLAAYRRHLLGALYARTLDVPCCRNGLLLQAFFDYQLARSRMQPWPMTAEHYGELLTHWRGPDDLDALFTAPADAGFRGSEWPAAYALVEFGQRFFEESTRVGMEEKLPNLATFSGLLRHLMPLDDRERPQAWATFLAQRQGTGVPAWPAGYDLTLACRSQSSFFDVQLYTFAPGELPQPAGIIEGAATLFDVHGLDGFLVQRVLTAEENQIPQVSFWSQDRETAVAGDRPEQILAMGSESWIQSLQQFVPLWQMNLHGDDTRGTGFALLDAGTCERGECTITPLPGYPDVSPDGEHVLTIDFAGTREESLGVSTTATPADIMWLPGGRWAFWIDARRFASISWDGRVQVATVDYPADGQRLVSAVELVSAAEIVAALPEEVRPPSGRAEISDGFANPTDPDQIYLFIAPDRGLSSRSTLLLVRYDVADGAVTLIDTPQRTSHYPLFSSDGRWMVLWSEAQGRGRFRQESKLTVLDTHHVDAQPVELAGDTDVTVQWLPGGEKLLINHGRFARLYAPKSGGTAVIHLPYGLRCQQTFWRARPVQ